MHATALNDTTDRVALALFSLVPYALVAWAYAAFTDGTSSDFWRALGVLILVRAGFGIIEMLGSVLTWHVYGKRRVVNLFLDFLRGHAFPKRAYAHDDFLGYLSRIEDNPAQPASVKAAAKEIYGALSTWERTGMILGMRMHSASETALETYSPRADAPVYGAPRAA
jgi:hypothetical protein